MTSYGRRLTLAALNTMPKRSFITALKDIYTNCPWIAERVADARPFSSLSVLHEVMSAALREATWAEQWAAFLAQPDPLVASGGLEHVLDRYLQKFDFPFILSAWPDGSDGREWLAIVAERMKNDVDVERRAALGELARIARKRLWEKVEDL